MKHTKTLRRVDTEIIKRILVTLHEEGRQRKTRMALKIHISYDKCRRYLEWLELMELVRKEKEQGSEYINLTSDGLVWYKKYSRQNRSHTV